jgi:cathepsin L
VKDATAITPNDPDALKTALGLGPIAIAVSANDTYLHYKGGIITTENEMCGNEDPPNHFTLSVGWGTDDTLGDYYIVKESFGTGWGE